MSVLSGNRCGLVSAVVFLTVLMYSKCHLGDLRVERKKKMSEPLISLEYDVLKGTYVNNQQESLTP